MSPNQVDEKSTDAAGQIQTEVPKFTFDLLAIANAALRMSSAVQSPQTSSNEKGAPATPTKEKATPSKEKATPSKEKFAANAVEKDNFTLLLAAIGPDLVGGAAYKKMFALNPDGRTASSWEHYFRGIKAKAKELLKEHEENGEDVSVFHFVFVEGWTRFEWEFGLL